jgi:hypothetical protein
MPVGAFAFWIRGLWLKPVTVSGQSPPTSIIVGKLPRVSAASYSDLHRSTSKGENMVIVAVSRIIRSGKSHQSNGSAGLFVASQSATL